MNINIQLIGLLLIGHLALSFAEKPSNGTDEAYDQQEEYDYNYQYSAEDTTDTVSLNASTSSPTLTNQANINTTISAMNNHTSSESVNSENSTYSPAEVLATSAISESTVQLNKTLIASEDTPTSQSNVSEIRCPDNCSCLDDDSLVQCTNLQQIPSQLPANTIILNLAKNSIKSIGPNDLESLLKLRHLNLSFNNLESIDKEAFSKLIHLDTVDLSSNLLKELDQALFKDTALTSLSLQNNPLTTSDGPFLMAPDLEFLNLANCQLQNLPNDFFNKMNSVSSLNLTANLFGEDFNVIALKSLNHLQQLSLVDGIERDNIGNICKQNEEIDTIVLSSYKVSCYEYTLTGIFEDSTSPLITISEATTAVSPKPTKKPTQSSATKGSSSNRNVDLISDQPMQPNKTNQGVVTAPPSKDTTPVDPKGTLSTSATDNDGQTKASGINTNNILIGIIIVAVIGLAIGIICRRDCCGIKTKCCRTKRPELPKDQYRHEETPLNKVVSQD